MSENYHKSIHNLSTIDITKMKAHYRFTKGDAQTLKSLLPIVKPSTTDLLPNFYKFIFGFEHAKLFLNTPEILHIHEEAIGLWFVELFNGTYDETYFQKLYIISEKHVKVGLPSHYVNTAFSFVRSFLEQLLQEKGQADKLTAVHKIIDINLDILSLSYQEEEQKQLINEIVILKRALFADTIVPYIQPIVNSKNSHIEKFECLMRFTDPADGILYSIYPFLESAKKIFVYEEMMKKMITRSFEVFKKNDFTFSVNLGYEDINSATFRRFLVDQIDAFDRPERIIFEILETDVISDFEVVLSFIKEIREYGCKIAIDDYGAGYSSMENVLKLQPDFIKIDGSLIKEVDHSTNSLAVVKSIITLAQELNIQTVAEYVHSEAVYKTLTSVNIDYYQGYYTGRPFPASQLK